MNENLRKTLEKTLETLFFPSSRSSRERKILARKEWEWMQYVPQEGVRLLLSNRKELELPLTPAANTPRFGIAKVNGGIWLGNGHLYATPEVVFFHGKVGEELEETLRLVQVFRSLLHALGISDLEGALEALARFKGEESRSYGPYVLAWSGNPEEPAFLRRGSIFGDHLLDGAFLTGREVVLRYPQVKVTLEGRVNERSPKTLFKMTRLTFEWDGVDASFVGGFSQGYLSCDLVLEKSPADRLLQRGAEEIIRKRLLYEKEARSYKLDKDWRLAPKMKAFLEILAETEDPLRALGDEDFFRQVTLRLLSFF